ncbi:hypothetical protein DKM44_05990 [Deinococcus irradiatisoli]|uniref:DUF4388 domain-containing protein n=1 Tax=Deinococcus irradiatisoli TaxID=2202254 RepID=A0A2Z3JHI1_9DEIO|nr:DUF4388 domain-containing protein [Deinococcus irradiatisoli]AWN22830.1 hypothetical protein DKM44_05990 [Deinococcus irradiatisoli]
MVQISAAQSAHEASGSDLPNSEHVSEGAARSPSSRHRPIIEGHFTYDSLEDLFMYLCSRKETLLWQLTTLAGTFTLSFDQGQPADIMFRPVRHIGAYVGLKALQTLFQQEGGQFTVRRGPPGITRRSLSGSGEELLISMAALNDERSAPAVLSGTTFDTSAELALVDDLPPEEHRTAFLTRSSEVALVEALQLFAVSRQAYRVLLTHTDGRMLGHIDLSANDVTSAATSTERGQAAFNIMLRASDELVIKVSPVRPPSPATSLGKLDSLLLQALSGVPAQSAQPAPAPNQAANPPEGATNPAALSPLSRLARLIRRK